MADLLQECFQNKFMPKRTSFKIQDSIFSVLPDAEQSEIFSVRSFPFPYEVRWSSDGAGKLVTESVLSGPGNILAIDEKVYNLFIQEFVDIPSDRIFKVTATEDDKILSSAVALIDFLQLKNFTKTDNLIVVGGGITQDICGFAAKIFKRGLKWIFFPTTLLSMCDSCIGAKTGLNHNRVKNQLAIFSAPSKIVICPQFLKTLDEQQIKSGLGEILKLHVTGGRDFLDNFEQLTEKGLVKDDGAYKSLIFGALEVKRAVIEVDEFEENLRKGLNYGHTFGHAIETLSNYAIPHGQAVVAGMLIVDELSYQLGFLSLAEKDYLYKLSMEVLDRTNKTKLRDLDIIGLINILRQDKKATGNKITLVLLSSIGNTIFEPVEINQDFQNKTGDIWNALFRE